MPSTNTKKIRNQYLLLYLITIFITGVGSFYALYSSYSSYEIRISNELLREANITNVQIEGSLASAQNVLEYDLTKITEQLNAGHLTKESAYKTMSFGQRVFGAFIADKSLFLTLYLDEQGVLQATNDGFDVNPINLSDRRYFQVLKNNPHRSFVIGNLVSARTTGLLTFHIAKSIIDKNGKFRGVLVQQLLSNNIAKTLKKSLDGLSDLQILVHVEGGNVVFAYPEPTQADEIKLVTSQKLSEIIRRDSGRSSVMYIPNSEDIPQDLYLAYAISETHNLETSVSIPRSSLWLSFIQETYHLFLYILLSAIAITIVTWRFYLYAVKNSIAIELSLYDELTHLKNRRALDAELPALWKESMRSKNPISALFIDIDHFKIFNDNYGHDCGDVALRAVAEAISASVTRPLDICCRWGGEEFAVVLPNTDEVGAITLTNQIMDAVRAIRFEFMPDITPHISISVGVVTIIVTKDNEGDNLIDMADKAMYKAKQGGRNRYVIYTK